VTGDPPGRAVARAAGTNEAIAGFPRRLP
jgi:hypothetical protein